MKENPPLAWTIATSAGQINPSVTSQVPPLRPTVYIPHSISKQRQGLLSA